MTTARNAVMVPWPRNRFLQWLAALSASIWVAGAIAPYNRFDWLLENLLVFAAVAAIIRWRDRRPLSDLAWLLIAIFLALHTVGAHYTYAEAPPGYWLRDALALDRNHYDRVIHFGFGLLIVYPVREYLMRRAGCGGLLGGLLGGLTAFAVIATASGLYEVLEWLVATVVSPEAALAYLGTQGDAFDAQKDTALAMCGAVCTLWLTRHHFAPPRTE
jgi:putative membrane protein